MAKKGVSAVVSAATSQPKLPSYKLTVDYDLSVDEVIKAGKYDRKNPDITSENFPSTRTGTADAEIILVHFGRYIKSEEVLQELVKQRLRAAELPELLAFGVKYPDVQREFPIVALGSAWQDPYGFSVPYLYGGSGRRDLHLRWFDSGWRSVYRFAAVRK